VAAGAAAWQQQLAALQQKHQQELEQARQEARCVIVCVLEMYGTLHSIILLYYLQAIGCALRMVWHTAHAVHTRANRLMYFNILLQSSKHTHTAASRAHHLPNSG
jgi:hypothetical protein